nr:rhomboid family intramembrane serine protease [uncultured Dysosmobacter sp.]
MRKLSAAVDRFAYNHPRFGIPNLMLYIVGANALIYLLTVFAGIGPVSFLAFDWASIKAGELWRLVTFLFMPGYFSSRDLIWLVLFLYLYYMIGSTLEREWGTAKFSLYYLSGAVLTILTGVLMGLITGNAVMMGADYVNLSLFFAFAALYPETRFVLFFIIPIKVKWLAIADGVLFAVSALGNLLHGDILGVVTPIIALLNFFVFFWGALADEIEYRRGRVRHQTSHQTIQFKSAVRQQRKKEAERGYRHKCDVCGRTDTDHPELEFRYCSRCAGYHCFCQDHIFNHEHFTE